MRTISTLFLIAVTMSVTGQSKYYPLDDSHSQVKFIGHLGGMMDVEGTFSKFFAYMRFDENDLKATSITLHIDPASVASANEWRDKHLKNEDFLDIEKYPRILFQSSSVKVDGNMLDVSGTLELKGSKREITVPMELVYPPTPDPWGNRRIGFKGRMEFSREDIGIGPTEGFWANGIADEFEMEFVISAAQRNLDRMGHFQQSPIKEIYEAAEREDVAFVKEQLVSLKEAGKLEPWMVNQMGQRLDQHEKPDQALEVYLLNQEIFEEDNSVYSFLAKAYLDRNREGAAKEMAQKALDLDPLDVMALEFLK